MTMTITSSYRFIVLLFFVCACSCSVTQTLPLPKISYTVKKGDIDSLTSPFPVLSRGENEETWACEYVVGKSLARDLDFYRAITAFKRALIMLPETTVQRRLEIQYSIVLCYYCAKKYIDVVTMFEESWLAHASETFPAYHDLLVILSESYAEIGDNAKSALLMKLLGSHDDERAKKLPLSLALKEQDIDTIEQSGQLPEFVTTFKKKAKSPSKARMFNAILPGAGYWYAEQKHTAITSFVLNGLFIAAAHHFFERSDTAMGVILTGFEAGWYFGGINGAGIAAQQYNHSLFTKEAYPFMEREKWFPVLMLHYTF